MNFWFGETASETKYGTRNNTADLVMDFIIYHIKNFMENYGEKNWLRHEK